MSTIEFNEMSNEELLQEEKKQKSTKILDAVIIGFLTGIAIYSVVKNGLGLLTFLPLVYLPIAAKNKVKNTELQKILKDKNLK